MFSVDINSRGISGMVSLAVAFAAMAYCSLDSVQGATEKDGKHAVIAPDQFVALRSHAAENFRSGNCRAAIPLIKDVLKYEPNDIEMGQMLAGSYNHVDEPKKALPVIDHVLKLSSTDGGMHQMQEDIYNKLHMPTQALAAKRSQEQYGFVPATWVALGQVQSPKVSGNVNAVIALLRSDIKRFPRCADFQLQLAEKLLANQRDNEAMQAAEDLLKVAPVHSANWRCAKIIQGKVTSNLGHFGPAKDYYTEALYPLEDKHSHADYPIASQILALALTGRAANWAGMDRNDKAASDITLLLENHVPEIHYYFLRAQYYRAAKQFEKALADYRTITSLHPGSQDAYLEQLKLLLQLKHWQEALSVSNLLIDRNSEDSELYMNRADAEAALGDLQKAVQDYSKAISIEPNEMRFYLKRAGIYRKQNKIDLAIADEKKIAALEHKH